MTAIKLIVAVVLSLCFVGCCPTQTQTFVLDKAGYAKIGNESVYLQCLGTWVKGTVTADQHLENCPALSGTVTLQRDDYNDMKGNWVQWYTAPDGRTAFSKVRVESATETQGVVWNDNGSSADKAARGALVPALVSRHYEWIDEIGTPFCREVELYDNTKKVYTAYVGKHKYSDDYPLWVDHTTCIKMEKTKGTHEGVS